MFSVCYNRSNENINEEDMSEALPVDPTKIYVRLSGLPYDVTEQHIADFLRGLLPSSYNQCLILNILL